MHYWNYCTIANTNLLQISIVGRLWSRLLWHDRSYINTSSASGSKSGTIVLCFACYSISLSWFDLLRCRKCMYSHTRMCFHILNAILLRDLLIWEIYLCWLISRSSLQFSPTPSKITCCNIHTGPVLSRFDRFLLIGLRAEGDPSLRLLIKANLHFLSKLLVYSAGTGPSFLSRFERPILFSHFSNGLLKYSIITLYHHSIAI